MKKTLLVFLFVLFSATYSDAASWEGLDWNAVNDGATVVSVVDGDLVVDSTLAQGWARAYTDTDYFEISVDIESGPKSIVMIDAFQSLHVIDQLGLDISGQSLFYDDDDETPVLISLDMPEDGIHTYSFKRESDGNVTIRLDGGVTPLWTSNSVDFDLDISMTSVLAGATYGTGVFTSASTVPIPSAVWLLGPGLIGLIGFRRKCRE